MPSHQDRVRQNNCNHSWPYMDRELLFNEDCPDGRKCIKCGADWDKAHRTKFAFISSPSSPSYQWIKNQFLK